VASFDGLKDWATERPKVAAGIGAGSILLVVLLFIAFTGGDDVAPVVGGDPAQPAAQGTEAANGTLVADPEQPASQDGDALVASGDSASGGSAGAVAPESQGDRDAAYANEQLMNAGLPAPPGLDASDGDAPLSSPPVTNKDVEYVGRKLELAADDVEECIDSGTGDIFECLKLLPKGFNVERIYETEPQGARFVVEGAEPVGIMIRGGTRCRTLGTSPDCNAWSAPSN
jgi:hypothetical protein